MTGELTLEERVAIQTACEVMAHLAEVRYAEGRSRAGDELSVEAAVLRRLLHRDLVRWTT